MIDNYKINNYEWNGVKILVIEDDITQIKILKNFFDKKTNATVYYITSLHENLIERINGIQNLDIIITDINFPGGTIFEYLKPINKLCKDVPVIIISGFYLQSDYEYYTTKKKLVVEWFNKPLKLNVLGDFIDGLIEGRKK